MFTFRGTRRVFCLVLTLLLGVFARAAVAQSAASLPPEVGFVDLFDGKSLDGWHVVGTPGWRVENGILLAPGKGSGWLRSNKEYADFVLRVTFRNTKNGNSGVFIRAGERGRTSRTGMEIQILDDADKPLSRTSSGALYDLVAPTRNAVKPVGEWNVYEITARGVEIRITLNGVPVQNVRTNDGVINAALEQRVIAEKAAYERCAVAAATTNAKAPSLPQPFPLLRERRRQGFVGLQNHGTSIEFGSVQIKVLEPGN